MPERTFNLPTLELAAWEHSKLTLNLYLQVVGKVELALMPRKNHWWNITFLPNAKGLVTHQMPAGDGTIEVQFNFLDHKVEFLASGGAYESFPLEDGLSVAEFYKKTMATLAKWHIFPKIIAHPYGFPDSNPLLTPFDQLTQFNSYNPDYVQRFWKIVLWTAGIFTEFGGKFYGKTSPVQLFWHHMDIVVTRFCGRRGPELPPETNIANKDAYSHELISFGFWAGDDILRSPAFYSYSYPSPPGIDNEQLLPGAARWANLYGTSPMALLLYDDVLKEPNPEQAVMSFLESCYMAGAKLLQWDIAGCEVKPLRDMK